MSRTENAPRSELSSASRIHADEPLYGALREFLEDEAALLDAERLEEWLALLADDLTYWMPVRVSAHRADGEGFAAKMGHFDDTKASIALRIRRLLKTQSGWVEDPPSRILRFVSGVRAYRTAESDEFRLESNLLVTRARGDAGDMQLLSARRVDLVRRAGKDFRLVRREIYGNQTTLGMQNLSIFL